MDFVRTDTTDTMLRYDAMRYGTWRYGNRYDVTIRCDTVLDDMVIDTMLRDDAIRYLTIW